MSEIYTDVDEAFDALKETLLKLGWVKTDWGFEYKSDYVKDIQLECDDKLSDQITLWSEDDIAVYSVEGCLIHDVDRRPYNYSLDFFNQKWGKVIEAEKLIRDQLLNQCLVDEPSLLHI